MKPILLASVCAASMFPALASAQTAPGEIPKSETAVSPPADADDGTAGDIVVTAQRREERLRDVPISITALSQDRIENAGLLGTRDLQQVTPGLVSQNSGYQFRPTIRGIGGYAGGGAGDESNIALYIDNVYMSSPGANAFNLMNIDRIEVLKGPQGTLFGRNATGGAVRIITSDPTYDYQLKANASYGFRTHSKEFNAFANAKIADTVAANLTGYYYSDDGYVRNVAPQWKGGKFARLDTFSFRGKLLFEPTDNFKVITGADYGKSRSSQENSLAPADDSWSFRNVVGAVLPNPAQPLTVSHEFEPFQYVRSGGGFITATLTLDKFTLQSTSVVRTTNVFGSSDSDRSSLALSVSNFSVDQDVLSQELIATSNFAGPFNFVAGVYYFDSDSTSRNGRLRSAPLSAVVNGVRNVTGPLATASLIRGHVQTQSYAAFGEGTLNLFEGFSLIGGLRYTSEDKSADINNMLRPDLGTSHGKISSSNTSYRVTAQYKYDDTGNVYLTRSTGFKSGQFNATAFTFPLTSVRPETLKAWEVGFKDRWFGAVDISLAAYDYRYNDIQLTVFNTLNPAFGTNILLNAAKAHTRGGELQVDGRINSSLSLNFGAAYLPLAKYSRFPNGIDYVPRADKLGNAQVITDLSGARIPYAPKWTANGGFTFNHPLADGQLILSANAYYTSRFEWIPGHRYGQESYMIVNSSIKWTAPEDRWSIGLSGRNLTNRHYFTAGAATTAGFSGAWARPREIVLTLGFEL